MDEQPQVALARLRQGLDDVEEAMRRLDDGTYGRCERCGQEIPAPWLEGHADGVALRLVPLTAG